MTMYYVSVTGPYYVKSENMTAGDHSPRDDESIIMEMPYVVG